MSLQNKKKIYLKKIVRKNLDVHKAYLSRSRYTYQNRHQMRNCVF